MFDILKFTLIFLLGGEDTLAAKGQGGIDLNITSFINIWSIKELISF